MLVKLVRFELLFIFGVTGLFSSILPIGVVTIATTFANPLPGDLQTRLQEETSKLFAGGMIRLQWRDLDAGPVREAFAHLVVAHFAGDCSPTFNQAPRHWPAVLGFTFMSEGRTIPFLQVDCDQVGALLAMARTGATRTQRVQMMGRAMARVLAHEVFHVLMETQEHSRYGLAKPQLNWEDLITSTGIFDKGDIRRIKVKLLGEVRELSADNRKKEHHSQRGDAEK